MKRRLILLFLLLVLTAAGAAADCGYTKTLDSGITEPKDGYRTIAEGSYILGEGGYEADSILVVPEDKTVNLCLHGETLTNAVTKKGIEVRGTLNLHDCRGGGAILNNGEPIIEVLDNGRFTMDGGRIATENSDDEGYGIVFSYNATGTITGGTIGDKDQNGGWLMRGVTASDSSNVTISGKAEVYGQGAVMCGKPEDSIEKVSAAVTIGGQAQIIGILAEDEGGIGAANCGTMTIDGDGVLIQGKTMGAVQIVGKMEIVRGRIEGEQTAIDIMAGDATIEDYESLVAEGSEVKEGSLTATYVVVGKKQAENAAAGGNAAADAELPQTGDASMLGAWMALLSASALGMRLRKKR